MKTGIQIKAVEPDADYLGIEIMASNGRFAGSTFIFAGLSELSTFAKQIAGFPIKMGDEREYKFGHSGHHVAGGYCSLRFYCVDLQGHAIVELVFEDDNQRFTSGTCNLSLNVEAAGIDRFCEELRTIEREKVGEAILPMSSLTSA